MKTYQVKSSAVRAAKQAGLVPNESAEIIQNEDGSWSFVDHRPVGTEDLLDDEFPIDGPELDAYGEEKPFEEITEKEHRTHRGEVGNKSSIDKPCSKVWDIAAAMYKVNPQVKRKEVLEACFNAGIAFYTTRTQYQEWFKASKNSK